MLRLLIPLLWLPVQLALAAQDRTTALEQAGQMHQDLQAHTTDVLRQVEELSRSAAFLDELNRAASRLDEADDDQGVATLPDLPAPDPELLNRARTEIGRLLDRVDGGTSAIGPPDSSGPRLYVFVSFSMPQLTLRRLLSQAGRIGAPLVLRGLVDDDMNATRMEVAELLEMDEHGDTAIDGGLSIDPTLYERFGVSAVPAFVLTTEPVEACTKDVCPSPDFVRLAGDVTVQYALETIAREAPAMRESARLLLTRMEGS